MVGGLDPPGISNDWRILAVCSEDDTGVGTGDDIRFCPLDNGDNDCDTSGYIFKSYSSMYDQTTLAHETTGERCKSGGSKCPINYIESEIWPLSNEEVTVVPDPLVEGAAGNVDFDDVALLQNAFTGSIP